MGSNIIYAAVTGVTAGFLIALGISEPHEPIHYAMVGAAFVLGMKTARRRRPPGE